LLTHASILYFGQWRDGGRGVYITGGAGPGRQSNSLSRFLPVFPVFRALPEHAQSQTLLECAVVDQVHQLIPFGLWGEVEFRNEVAERSLAKLQASIVVAAVTVLMRDPFAVARFRDRERVDPLR
jgi:hypothetical protein